MSRKNPAQPFLWVVLDSPEGIAMREPVTPTLSSLPAGRQAPAGGLN